MVIRRELNIQLWWEEENVNENFFTRLSPSKQVQIFTYSWKRSESTSLDCLLQIQTQTFNKCMKCTHFQNIITHNFKGLQESGTHPSSIPDVNV